MKKNSEKIHRTVTFEFLAGRETRRNVVQALDQVACFSHPTKSFAYSFNPLKFQSSRFMASKHNGWNIYNIEEEYKVKKYLRKLLNNSNYSKKLLKNL